ncbi:response regulator transcription factor [Streptomyces mirabilis]|uniref:response regulator transcription factor n=1 Tax=Streptomyces mirabilis TaxID=68239 RepID=UPI0033A3DA4A
MITVLILNDQALQRLGLRLFLDAQPGVTVVGEATTGVQASQAAASLRPDVILMDMGLPDDDGLRTIRHIARPGHRPESHPPRTTRPRVLVLTPVDTDEFAWAALRAGAGGFLPKDALPDQLTAAIHIVAQGGSVLSPRLTRSLVAALRRQDPSRKPKNAGRLALLTEREREVLTALASGRSSTEMAQRLSIAPATVKTHISGILAKIGVRARVQAVVIAYETGLVRPV